MNKQIEAMKQAIIEEASIQMTHPSKDARWFAKSVYEYLVAEQPAPAQPLTDEQANDIMERESWGSDATTLNAALLRTIRRTEAAHGITKGGA